MKPGIFSRFPLAVILSAAVLHAQVKFEVYTRLDIHTVYPIANSFVFAKGEDNVLDLGFNAYRPNSSTGTLSSDFEVLGRKYDYSDVRATSKEKGNRLFVSWKRKGKYLGNHINLMIPNFDPDYWTLYGAGLGIEAGVNKSFGLGPLAATGSLGVENTDDVEDADYWLYTTDSTGNLVDSVFRIDGGGNGAPHLKFGLTIQNSLPLSKIYLAYSLNLSYAHKFHAIDDFENFPMNTVTNGLVVKYMIWKWFALSGAYYRTWVFHEIFPTVSVHRFEAMLSL